MNTNESQNSVNTMQGDVNVTQPGVAPASPVPTATPTVAPVQPVTPQPMPAQEPAPVPQPMPAPAQEVTPTPVVAPTAAPSEVMPKAEETTPQVAPPLPKTEPQVVMPSPGAAPAEVVPGPAANPEDVTVISTTKSRTSNIILILVIALLIGFVFNIDKVIEIYENYTQTGSLTPPVEPTDNVTDGFVMIDDNNSSVKVEGIKFYYFKKADGQKLSLSFESETKYDKPADLGIYIEIYNSNKELLYKTLFNPNEVIEANTVRKYSIDLTNEIYESIFYAKVKTYTEEEANATSNMVCKLTKDGVNYTNTYNFKNNTLEKYDVQMELVTPKANEEEKAFESEYEKVKDLGNAKLDDNSLTYSVDVTKEYENYTVLYTKDATKLIIKNKEELKEWTCE